jgi:hypothetical protein
MADVQIKLIGLPTYPSAYDKFLIVVGLVFNALTVWVAWQWVEPGKTAPGGHALDREERVGAIDLGLEEGHQP